MIIMMMMTVDLLIKVALRQSINADLRMTIRVEILDVAAESDISHTLLFTLTLRQSTMDKHLQELSEEKVESRKNEEDPRL